MDLAFLVGAQHQGMVGRIQVQPNDIDQFVNEAGIVAGFEGPGQVGLEVVGMPDPQDHRGTDTEFLGQRTGRPVRGVGRSGLGGTLDDEAGHLVAADGLAPAAGASLAMPARRFWAKRERQRATVRRSVPTRGAMSLFFMPSAANRTIFARSTCRAGVLRP